MPATHVLIRGHQFTYAEKAPFAVSGESVLGAIEYDETTDQTKCHECGEWFSGMGNHIKSHGIKRDTYNEKHGMRIRSSLSGFTVRQKHRTLATKAFEGGGNLNRVDVEKKDAARIATNKRRKGTAGNTAEYDNERARCKAQSLFKIQTLAAQTGHTPTSAELSQIGLGSTMLASRFGCVKNAMRLAGLEPNLDGHVPMSVPKGFPTAEEIAERKRRWEAPMPWPKDDGPSLPFSRSAIAGAMER
jgi:hypothetical protein